MYREGPDVLETAEKLYAQLEAEGVEVLYDDRQESPGIKFNDADLLGIPLRITLSPRTLQNNSVELKWRSKQESELVPLEDVVAKLKEIISEDSSGLSNPA